MGVLGSLLSTLAVLGLGLAALGVYGVIARTVAQPSTGPARETSRGPSTLGVRRIAR